MKSEEFAHPEGLEQRIVDQVRQDLKSVRNGPWHREGAWSISPHNFRPETKPPATVPADVVLVDITARVDEQIPGVAFTLDERVRIAKALSDAGVPEMQATLYQRTPRMKEQLRAVTSLKLPIKIVAMTSTDEDVEEAASCGVQIAEITTVGRPSLFSSYNRSFMASTEDLLRSAVQRIRLAKSLGLAVRADVNTVSYAEADYIRRFAAAAVEAGAESIYLADSSVGLGPRAAGYLVKLVRAEAPTVPVGFHLHNDFGLALSNAIAALEEGASIFDVTVNGGGERSGQLDLAPLALVVEAFYGVRTGLKFDRLYALSKLVQDATRMPLPGTFPVVGEFAFSSAVQGVQIEEVYVDPSTHVSLDPDFVGNRRGFPLGRHTGRFGLLHHAERLGYQVKESQVDQMLNDLDEWFEHHKRPMPDGEFADFLRQHGCTESAAPDSRSRSHSPAHR